MESLAVADRPNARFASPRALWQQDHTEPRGALEFPRLARVGARVAVRAAMRSLRFFLALSLSSLGVLACGGGTSDTGAASGVSTRDAGAPPPGHRANAVACGPSPAPSDPPSNSSADACRVQSDCVKQGKNGHCVFDHHLGSNACEYDQCLSDSDCNGGACLCADSSNDGSRFTNACLPAECRTDADCGQDGFCVLAFTACSLDGYYCSRPTDACSPSRACAEGQCVYDTDNHAWLCSTIPEMCF